ncbi:MAG: hypothetical protein WD988_01490 [Candidatus Curtissbacteria bacterium]
MKKPAKDFSKNKYELINLTEKVINHVLQNPRTRSIEMETFESGDINGKVHGNMLTNGLGLSGGKKKGVYTRLKVSFNDP